MSPISVPGSSAIQKINIFLPGASATPFDPTIVPGCVFWVSTLKPTTINSGSPANGDPMTTWNDLSSSGNSATGASPNTLVYTTNAINGKPGALATASSSQSMVLTSIIGSLSEFSIFLVFQPNSTSRQTLLGWSSGGDTATLPDINSSGTTEIYDGGGANFTNFTQSFPINSPYILAIQSGHNASNLVYKTNNVTITPSLQLGSGWSAFIDLIGRNKNNALHADGYFGDIIIYNRSVTDTEAAKIYSYLTTQYGLMMMSEEKITEKLSKINKSVLKTRVLIIGSTIATIAALATVAHFVMHWF